MMSWWVLALLALLGLVALWSLSAAAAAGVVLARRYAAQRKMPDAAELERAQQLLEWSKRYKSSMGQLRDERAALAAKRDALHEQAQALDLRLADLRGRVIASLEELEAIERRKALVKGLRIS